MNKLSYRPGDRYIPIPPSEKDLPTITADYFVQVHDVKGLHTEGLCFDREGNLYYTVVYAGLIGRVDMKTKEITEVYRDENIKAASVKIHKDGRLFVSCLNKKVGDVVHKGKVFAINPDGTGYEEIVSGYSIDDIVFDEQGGFYFTELIGDVTNPTGGVYYVSPDYKTVTPYIMNLATPNGITLATDNSVMWITESHCGRIHRIMRTSFMTSNMVYQVPGFYGPDSCSVDMDDNLYVAMCGQGRVLIFNYYGMPIGQVLLPHRDEGHNLWCTHPMVRPGTNELYIISCDDNGDEGSWIFKAEVFAEGNIKAYQFT